MTKVKAKVQRETLFASAEEKTAEVTAYKLRDQELEAVERACTAQLERVRQEREELASRIQELQNLDLFKEGGK